MATYYADSSVLTKRHITETGTPWVQALTNPAAGHVFITSRKRHNDSAPDSRDVDLAESEASRLVCLVQ